MADRFYDKLGFQMIQQNQAFMRCPHDVKGVFFELRIMAGNSEYEDGTIPVGRTTRSTRDDLLDYFTGFDRAKRNYFEKVLKRLIAVGVLEFYGKSDIARIPFYTEEQELGRTTEAYRKRATQANKFDEIVVDVGNRLKSLFRRTNATGLPHDNLVAFVRAEINCYKAKAEEILNRLSARGVLIIREDGLSTLASLAPPPETGSGHGSGHGAGAELSGGRKVPLESEPEKETFVSSAGSGSGTRPSGPSDTHGSPASGSGGGGASEARHSSADTLLLSPEDAWSARDPVEAAEDFLRKKPGWTETGDERGPPSKFVIRSRWRDLRKSVGVAEAERIWRQALFDIVMDHCDRQSWRSWSAGFFSKLKIGVEAAASRKEAGGYGG